MKKVYAAIAAALTTLGISNMALAVGPVTVSAFQAANSSGCAYFQVTGSNQWYAIPLSGAYFSSQFGFIMGAFYSGTPITFNPAGPACGYPTIQYMYVGTPM